MGFGKQELTFPQALRQSQAIKRSSFFGLHAFCAVVSDPSAVVLSSGILFTKQSSRYYVAVTDVLVMRVSVPDPGGR